MATATQMSTKTIRDSVYGNVEVSGLFLELLHRPEMQRLHGIRQLGLTYLVYPGANHTRLEHSLGTCYVARRMAAALSLPEKERQAVGVAALLHDIGHGPFSHTLEYLLHLATGKNHETITRDMIVGTTTLADVDMPETLPRVLEDHGIDPADISAILAGERGHLSDIIHGPVDADQIDFLRRDAHYTGVAYGVIDFDRLMQTLTLHDGRLAIAKKGVSALESMLVARALMYSSVYLHKTVRIAELMLVRAVERAPPFDFSQMTDGETIQALKDMGPLQRDIALRLKYRQLFKRAYWRSLATLSGEEKKHLAELDTKQAENDIARRAGLDDGYVIVDVPGRDILLSEPRLRKMDLQVLEEGTLSPLSQHTPLTNALQLRGITDWGIMVACPEDARDRVAEIAPGVLWG
ncbi:MAG: HD domain-containing protein [Candidatus Thermoplasmatota archaeon]|nr:HD domain-containing protein [Candidatus Thermoplasmatota archaeon]